MTDWWLDRGHGLTFKWTSLTKWYLWTDPDFKNALNLYYSRCSTWRKRANPKRRKHRDSTHFWPKVKTKPWSDWLIQFDEHFVYDFETVLSFWDELFQNFSILASNYILRSFTNIFNIVSAKLGYDSNLGITLKDYNLTGDRKCTWPRLGFHWISPVFDEPITSQVKFSTNI
jgi:hypothetical protein